MPIKTYKPTSAGRRDMTGYTFEEITKKKPERSLTTALRKTGGRNNKGRVTVRHRGGGNKRRYRIIDFKRNKFDFKAEVIAIEYDPNRSARIALLQYEDGEKRYIIAPLGLKVGDVIGNGPLAELRPGNTMAIKDIPVGTIIHNLETQARQGRTSRSLCRDIRAVVGERRHLCRRSYAQWRNALLARKLHGNHRASR
jgi:large subunit ribosomal protein L2